MPDKTIKTDVGTVKIGDDGTISLSVNKITKISIDNITDVHSHVIMREGDTTVHQIKFRDEGSVDLAYKADGKLVRFAADKIQTSVDSSGVVVLMRKDA